jgi:hypothetical protein
MEKHYIKANEIIMSETQVEEMVVLQEMENDIVPKDVPLVPENNDSNKALSYKAYGFRKYQAIH